MARLVCAIAIMAAFGAVAEDGAAIKAAVVNPLERVRLEQSVDGDAAAEVYAARGEYESFQVVVTAQNGPLVDVNASASPLENGSGGVLDASHVTLYREVFVPVRHSVRYGVCPPGLVPDALVPFVNPYTGEEIAEPKWTDGKRVGPRFGAADFDVFEGQNAVIWVDVRVPTDAKPGVYEGALKLTADNAAAVEVPVRLTVWDFVLPPGPTHENHFGGFERVAGYYGLDANSEQFHKIEDRYIAMMAEHRINPPVPARLKPEVGEDGTPQFSEELTAKWAEFMKRYNVTNVQVPRAPFGDITGANREKAVNFYRGWYAFLDANGWAERAYLYMLDEPNDAEAYERVRELGAVVAEAEPRLRRLVVEQPYTQNPAWGQLDQAVDIWCPLFGFIDGDSVGRVQANGDEVWSYTALVQTAPPYHPKYESVKGWKPPFWELDFASSGYRTSPWLNRRYNITGVLYWSSVYWGSPDRNPWDDPGFRVRYNGEGALFYPGDDAGIEGPVASIRLKSLRDGMEDYEYFALLEKLSGADAVLSVVKEAVPDWGSITCDSAKILSLRRKLGAAIEGKG